jgi:hypothetical protein
MPGGFCSVSGSFFTPIVLETWRVANCLVRFRSGVRSGDKSNCVCLLPWADPQ